MGYLGNEQESNCQISWDFSELIYDMKNLYIPFVNIVYYIHMFSFSNLRVPYIILPLSARIYVCRYINFSCKLYHNFINETITVVICWCYGPLKHNVSSWVLPMLNASMKHFCQRGMWWCSVHKWTIMYQHGICWCHIHHRGMLCQRDKWWFDVRKWSIMWH